MTVFIVGGSNSLMKTGWTKNAAHLFPNEDVVNLSIGATCSLTGLYRSVFTADIFSGDTIVWEYALNDANQISSGFVSAEFLLKYIELLLAICFQRRVRFVALIFKSQNLENIEGENDYHTLLKALLDTWDVRYSDISVEYRNDFKVDKVPADMFADPLHYSVNSSIMDYIEGHVVSLFASATCPAYNERVYSDPKWGIDFISHFEGGEGDVVGSRWFSCYAYKPTQTLRHRFKSDGLLLGIILLAAPLGGAFRISCGTRQLDVSATLAKPQEITRLSPSFFDPVICPALSFESADELVISWSSLNTEDVFCGGVNKRKVSFQDLEGRASAIVGLLVARPGGIGSVQIDQKAQDDFSIAKHLRNILLRWR